VKIGFIAMSGVRVQDPELITLRLNLPGFVERSEVIASLPSLGLLTLAGMTPPHIDVAYLAEHADAVVVGEAEAVWSAVLRDLDPPHAPCLSPAMAVQHSW